MKIKSIEWWDDSVLGCTLTCSCGNEIETVIENDDVIECDSCKQSWQCHVHRTFTPIKQMEIKSVEWWDDSVLGPCILRCDCGNEIEKELVGDGDIITCDSCKRLWQYHQKISHTFTQSKIKDGSDTKAFQDALSPPDLQHEWMDDENIF